MPGNTKQPLHLQFQKGSGTKHFWVYKHIIQIHLQYRLPFQIIRSSWQIHICVLQSPELVTEKSCQDLNVSYITLWLKVFTGGIIYQPQHHCANVCIAALLGKGREGAQVAVPQPCDPCARNGKEKRQEGIRAPHGAGAQPTGMFSAMLAPEEIFSNTLGKPAWHRKRHRKLSLLYLWIYSHR